MVRPFCCVGFITSSSAVDEQDMDIRVVAISDPHGNLPVIPDCEILLIAGDICPAHDHHVQYQAAWLDNYFRRWLDRVPAKRVVGIFGNHDFIGMEAPNLIPSDLRWDYLECNEIEIEGIRIWGSPWSNFFYDWAFNSPKENGEQWLAEKIYSHIPEGTDIIVTHGPPFGGDPLAHQLSDFTQAYKGNPRQHVGSKALLSAMRHIKPAAVFTGHIHCGYGVYEIDLSIEPETEAPCIVANASVVNEKYSLTNPPLCFVWNMDDRTLEHVPKFANKEESSGG